MMYDIISQKNIKMFEMYDFMIIVVKY